MNSYYNDKTIINKYLCIFTLSIMREQFDALDVPLFLQA